MLLPSHCKCGWAIPAKLVVGVTLQNIDKNLSAVSPLAPLASLPQHIHLVFDCPECGENYHLHPLRSTTLVAPESQCDPKSN